MDETYTDPAIPYDELWETYQDLNVYTDNVEARATAAEEHLANVLREAHYMARKLVPLESAVRDLNDTNALYTLQDVIRTLSELK